MILQLKPVGPLLTPLLCSHNGSSQVSMWGCVVAELVCVCLAVMVKVPGTIVCSNNVIRQTGRSSSQSDQGVRFQIGYCQLQSGHSRVSPC
jgi:hypothetical protein